MCFLLNSVQQEAYGICYSVKRQTRKALGESSSNVVRIHASVHRMFHTLVTLDNFRISDLLADGHVLQKKIRTNILLAFSQFQSCRL